MEGRCRTSGIALNQLHISLFTTVAPTTGFRFIQFCMILYDPVQFCRVITDRYIGRGIYILVCATDHQHTPVTTVGSLADDGSVDCKSSSICIASTTQRDWPGDTSKVFLWLRISECPFSLVAINHIRYISIPQRTRRAAIKLYLWLLLLLLMVFVCCYDRQPEVAGDCGWWFHLSKGCNPFYIASISPSRLGKIVLEVSRVWQ